jgi:hypothetical protein
VEVAQQTLVESQSGTYLKARRILAPKLNTDPVRLWGYAFKIDGFEVA